MATTGKTIAKLRKDAGLTQASLAEKLGVSDKAVSKWERGVSCPDVSLWGKLSIFLDTDIEGLIYGYSISEEWIGILVLENKVPADVLVYDKPLINYLISQFLLVGIKDIIIVGDCKIHNEKINIQVKKRLNHWYTKNAFLIFGNQFLYGSNLTRHFKRAMYTNEITVVSLVKGKGRYPLSVDTDRNAILSDKKSLNKYYALPYVFIPREENVDTLEMILSKKVKTECLERGIIHFSINSFDSVTQMSQFVKIIQDNSGEIIADIDEIIERRK